MRRFSRRARVRFLTLAATLAVAGPWWVPTGAVVPAIANPGAVPGTGCGSTWTSAEQLHSLPGGLLEVSGFVSSARYPGVAWMIQDSDNPRNLYSFTLEGGRPSWRKFPIAGTDNHDWEDLAYTVGADGRGRLWIWENAVETGPKTLYEVLEPDPHQDTSAQLAARYRVEYPGANINTESIFALGGRLAVVTKTSPNRVFELPVTLSRTGTNRLSEAGRLDAGSFLTAVAVSGDERLLATVSTKDVISVFENPAGRSEVGAFAHQDPVFEKSMVKTQRESLDFFPHDSCDLVSVSEDGTVWRLANGGTVRPVHPAVQPGPPTGVTAVASPGSATVSWVPPADTGGLAISTYEVRTYQDGRELPAVTTVDGSATSAVVGGLAEGVAYTFTVRALNDLGAGPASPPTAAVTPAPSAPAPPAAARSGYWTLGADGIVSAFGDAPHLGSPGAALGGRRAVDLEPTASGAGYWVVDDLGRVHAFGDAAHLGDVGIKSLVVGETVTSLSGLPSGDGYRVFTSRGRIVPFGAAAHLGDLAGTALNAPVLDSVTTPTGAGYWMVAADGGIFTFGDAIFAGSMGGTRLNAPVRSLVPDPDGAGYWLVAADGGVFAFDAPFRGSLGGVRLNRPVAGMVSYGNGYLMVGEDGGVFNFSDRPFAGSLGGRPPTHPVVSIAALG